MIAKVDLVANGLKLMNYVLREDKQAELIAANMIGSDNPSEIHEAFSAIADRNKRCKLKYISMKIGISPDDEARFRKNPDKLEAICNDFSKELGFDNHQWFACTHNDTDNLHIHMIINRIPVDGIKACNIDFISNRAFRVAESISRKRGLTIASKIRKNGNNQYHDSSNRARARAKVEFIALQSLTLKPQSLTQFISIMQNEGVDVVKRIHKNKGKIYGLRFEVDGERFKASEIDKKFGYNRLINTINENRNNVSQSIYGTVNTQTDDQNKVQQQNTAESIANLIGSADEQDNKKRKRKKKNSRKY